MNRKDFLQRPIIFADSQNEQGTCLTGEDCRVRNLNQWKGWRCAVGIRSLHVEFDGDVYNASCREGARRGNIYDENFKLAINPAKWLTCSQNACTCVPDMYVPKVRADREIPADISKFKQFVARGRLQEETLNPDMVFSPYALEAKILIWEIGRRCNYNCSYCYPNSHSLTEKHKSLETLLPAMDRLEKYFLRQEPGHFILLGGEPTIHPSYLEFLRYILSKNSEHRLLTVTNGSRSAEFYAELFQLSALSFSAHLEYLANASVYAKFLKNIATCVRLKQSEQVPADRDLQVRVMLKPGGTELASRLKADIQNIPYAAENVRLLVDLLHQSDERVVLNTYTAEELQFGLSPG